MYILLVNTNPVVSRLISLNTSSDAEMQVDEIAGDEEVPRKQYDVVFIDEKCCDEERIRAYIQEVNASEKVLFSAQREKHIEGIDRVIVKPFLPSEISAVLQMILPGTIMEDEDDGLYMSVEAKEAYLSDEENPILDSNEIEKIKQLLDEESESLGEVTEPDIQEKMLAEEEKAAKKSRKKKARRKKRKKRGFEENLLISLTEMKPKRVRELLRGAEVNITIRFPQEV